MNKTIIISLFTFLTFANVNAAMNCSLEGSRYENITCTLNEVKKAEKEINILVAEILGKLKKQESNKFTIEHKKWKEKLKSNIEKKEFDEGGSLGRLMRVNYKLDLLLNRITELKDTKRAK